MGKWELIDAIAGRADRPRPDLGPETGTGSHHAYFAPALRNRRSYAVRDERCA